MERICHVKTFGQQPASLGVNRGAAGVIVLGNHMIDGTAATHAARKHAGGSAEEKVDEISVMNVQIEQRAAQIGAARVRPLFAPAWHF